MSMKYAVTVAMTYWQTIEVDADSREEANATAFDLFDIDQAHQGEGDIHQTEEVVDIATDETRSYGPQGETA
jgi:hypothetical protein